jgi:hypothetical protein
MTRRRWRRRSGRADPGGRDFQGMSHSFLSALGVKPGALTFLRAGGWWWATGVGRAGRALTGLGGHSTIGHSLLKETGV